MPQGINGIKGKFPVTIKVVLEIRYRQGFTYLDRCGRTINLIQEYYPAWILSQAGANPQNAGMVDIEHGLKCNFSSQKIDITVDRPMKSGELDSEKLEHFATTAEELSSIVLDQLSLADFSRIGCRVWYLFDAQTLDEASSFIDSLGLFQISPSLVNAFGGDKESSSVAVVINGEDRKFRVAIDSMERAIEVDLGDAVVNVPPAAISPGRRLKPAESKVIAKANRKRMIDEQRLANLRGKHSPFAAVLDVDAYREDPEIIKPKDFVLSSIELAGKGIRAAVDKMVS